MITLFQLPVIIMATFNLISFNVIWHVLGETIFFLPFYKFRNCCCMCVHISTKLIFLKLNTSLYNVKSMLNYLTIWHFIWMFKIYSIWGPLNM